MSTEGGLTHAEAALVESLAEIRDGEFLYELDQVAKEVLDRELLQQVLGRALLLALPEESQNFPDEFFAIDPSSPETYAPFLESLKLQDTKWTKILASHIDDRRRLAILLGRCAQAGALDLAKRLWPRRPGEKEKFDLEAAIAMVQRDREATEQHLREIQGETALALSASLREGLERTLAEGPPQKDTEWAAFAEWQKRTRQGIPGTEIDDWNTAREKLLPQVRKEYLLSAAKNLRVRHPSAIHSPGVLLVEIFGEQPNIPDSFASLLEGSRADPSKRKQMIASFRRFLQEGARELACGIASQGFRTLATIVGVPKHLWRGGVNAVHTPIWHRNPETRELREILHAAEHRQMLKDLKDADNLKARDTYEKGVIHLVTSAVMTYPYRAAYSEELPAYKANAPQHVVSKRDITCFTGPWLLATMLRECGIPENRMFCCSDVQYRDRKYHGDHGALLVLTCNNDLLLLDIGHTKTYAALQAMDVDKADQFRELLRGKSSLPLQLSIDEGMEEKYALPMRMQVMPLGEGIASTHMTNTGLHFSHEGRPREAQYAFELGLGLNPLNTYLLSYLGTSLFAQGRTEDAKERLHEALTMDDGQLYAYFTLGEIALAEGNVPEARKRFMVLAESCQSIYGDRDTLKETAKRYLALTDTEMLEAWRKKQQKDV